MRQAKINKKRFLFHALTIFVLLQAHGNTFADTWAASFSPMDYRFSAAQDKFDDVAQYAVAFHVRPPRRLRARSLELAIGSISSSQDDRGFVSFGPVWRFPIARQGMFVELGFSPTLITGSKFNGRDLGGNFHFTSSFALGATFGYRKRVAVSLRAQHTSNGGLHETNPGIDMVGINLSFDLSNR